MWSAAYSSASFPAYRAGACGVARSRAYASIRGPVVQVMAKVLFEWAIEQCRQKGCGLVQLTTDKRRPDAVRFYERLGFEASHEGMKLSL